MGALGFRRPLPLLLALLAAAVEARFVVEKNSLMVTSPTSLRGRRDSAIGNFGIPQYGGSMAGAVVYPKDNANACDDFDGKHPFRAKPGAMPTFLLIDRGDCLFAKKVWNAQNAGASAVLVVDDKDEPLITMDLPREDDEAANYIQNITIPSALIDKKFGEQLKKAVKDGEMVNVNLDWREAVPHPDDRVEYELWTNSNDECGPKCDMLMNFLKEFKGAAQLLEKGGYSQFTPHYITWYCPQAFVISKQCKSQCINHGRYCAPDPEQDFSTGYEGKDVVVENLRQLCVYKVANEHKKPWVWWDYATDFHIRCPMKEKKYNKKCAETVIKSLGLDVKKVDKCMGDPNADYDHPLLKMEQDAQIGKGSRGDVTILPTLVVNNRQYRGKLERKAVLKAICAGFEETTEPNVCLSDDIESNECLNDNGGCWQDKAANVTACRDTFRGRVCECPMFNGVQFKGDGYSNCERIPPPCRPAAHTPNTAALCAPFMEDEEEVQGMLPPVAPSLESRSKRKKTPSAMGNRGGRGRGRGRGRGSADTDTHIEPSAEDEDNGENFDMNDASAISLSVPTDDDDADGDASQQEDGDDISMASNASKPTRGRKKLKAGTGIHLSPSKTKVKRGKRAGCWKYFKEIHVQSEKEFGVMVTKAKCRFCHKSYVYHQGGATSQLNRHLSRCTQFQNKLAKAKRQLAQGTLNYVADDGCLVVNPTEYDHEHTRKLIAKMIIVHEYSFRMVEHKWFNILMKWMNSNYESIGRKTIKNECMKVYESEKEQLRKSLREAESISLTTDLWTSNQNVQYMCLVAHYIDSDWVLQCRVINFLEVDPPHTGLVIAHAVFECLVEWKIEDKVMSITLDNASNNDTATTNLSAKLLARKNGQFDPIYFHVRCAAHIVNLVVNDGLNQIEGLISDLRNTVKYFKRSPSRLYKFVEVCNDYAIEVGKCLSLDVKTRWNSTYKMLDTCIQYRPAFGYYAQVDQNYAWKPTESEWNIYEKIRPILGEMAGATTAFSGSVYPTANVFYPYILKVKIALLKAKNSDDPYLKEMGAAMLDKFDKYWEEKNNVMVIATILDPRFKMRYIQFYFNGLYGPTRCEQEVADIKKELEELYKKHELEQRRKIGGSNSLSTTQSASSSKETTSSVACLVSSEFQSFLESSVSESSKSELLIYLDEANHSLNDKNFNLLQYWKVNALRFPVVSSMAKKFLAVPASSVSSESTFSCGGRILDDYRSSLKPATVQALVCASSWIRGSKSPPVILGEDGDDGDIETVELLSSVVESNH